MMPMKCEELPAVKDAKEVLPGCALTQAMNSDSVLAGMPLRTASTIVMPITLVTGLKSVSGL
jgi:hypothetical protein